MPPGFWTGRRRAALAPPGSPGAGGRAGGILALAGAGVEKSGPEDLRAFAERFEIPVATTLRAKGVFPEITVSPGSSATPATATPSKPSSPRGGGPPGVGLRPQPAGYPVLGPKMLPSRALVQVDIDPHVIGRTFSAQVPWWATAAGCCKFCVSYRLRARSRPSKAAEPTAPRLQGGWPVRASGPRPL